MMETYNVIFNNSVVGLIASPVSVEEDVNLMADTMLQLMTKMGFSSIAEYQNNLPGHSDRDLSGFDEPYYRMIRYNLFGKHSDNHPIGITLSRNSLANDDLFKDLRSIFFEDNRVGCCCNFILQPVVEDMKRVVRNMNYKTDEYFWYCSDWKDSPKKKFISELHSVIHTFEGSVACLLAFSVSAVSLTNYFDNVSMHPIRLWILLLLDVFLWVNGIIKANPGSNIIPTWVKRFSESIFPSKP